jgi:hypothetical protein
MTVETGEGGGQFYTHALKGWRAAERPTRNPASKSTRGSPQQQQQQPAASPRTSPSNGFAMGDS